MSAERGKLLNLREERHEADCFHNLKDPKPFSHFQQKFIAVKSIFIE